MDKTLRIAELISTDIRSRANANIIRSVIDGIEGHIVLDFGNVTFASRSFMDELYNVTLEHKDIVLSHLSGIVESMWNAVCQGRKTNRRVPANDNSEMKEFNDMKSLEAFLSTI